MKKLLLSAGVVAALFAAPNTNANLEKQITKLQQELKQLKQQVQSQNLRYYKKVAPIVTNSHLFLSADIRTTYDVIVEKTNSGNTFTTVTPNQNGTITYSNFGHVNSKTYANQILTNRLILTGVAKPSDNLKATVRIEANDIFGMNDEEQYSPYQNIPWVANETPDDLNLRLKQAFFNYFFGNGFMFSAGRRPSTEGFPANLREGDAPNSPLAHLINMEFDGFSFEIGNSVFGRLNSKFLNWGTWIKFCAGRGYSSSKGIWPYDGSPAYSKDTFSNTDFAGFLFIPYDDGQYSLKTETIWAWHMKGYNFATPTDALNAQNGKSFNVSMQDLGNYFGENIVFEAQGIGDDGFQSEWLNNFLDDTTAFISYAFTKTHPKSGKQMLGSTSPKFGSSIWIGADMDGFRPNDRWGFNFVHGSKYYRAMTYAEDTLVGSIAAVRGNAYEVYYNAQIIPHLTAGLRYTYIRYQHSGSNGFFGISGSPDNPVYVQKATDIRAYIKYKF
jgi:hypothetical protein